MSGGRVDGRSICSDGVFLAAGRRCASTTIWFGGSQHVPRRLEPRAEAANDGIAVRIDCYGNRRIALSDA